MSKEFDIIKGEVHEGKEPSATVREVLGWFGFQRRGLKVIERIREELSEAGIITDPDFTNPWIDSKITLKKDPGECLNPRKKRKSFQVRMLKSASSGVESVKSEDTIEKAVTLMFLHGYSQLPVIDKKRGCEGAITWRTICECIFFGKKYSKVKDAMESPILVDDDESMLNTTKLVIEHGYVIVRSSENKITGIVTVTDISEEFHILSEPFFLIWQIENHIRYIIQKIDTENLKKILDTIREEHKPGGELVESVSDLTFGDYCRIIENEENWKKLNLFLDRSTFSKQMEEVRKIRNDVMHFHPDETDQNQLDQLKSFLFLLEKINEI